MFSVLYFIKEGVTPLIVGRIQANFREYSVLRDPGKQYAKNARHSGRLRFDCQWLTIVGE